MATFSPQLGIHNALWEAFDGRADTTLVLGGHPYVVQYQNTPEAHRARVVLYGTVWESQNMRKRSPNTSRISKTPGLRISWAFTQGDEPGGPVTWLQRVESRDHDDKRLYVRYDLRSHPQRVVERASVPLTYFD